MQKLADYQLQVAEEACAADFVQPIQEDGDAALFQQCAEMLFEVITFGIVTRFDCGGDGFAKEQVFERGLLKIGGGELFEFEEDWETICRTETQVADAPRTASVGSITPLFERLPCKITQQCRLAASGCACNNCVRVTA